MTELNYDLVVLGGVAAGTSGASSAKRENPNLKIAIFQNEPYISYGACGLPYVLTADVKYLKDLFAYTPEKFQEEKDIDVYTLHEAKEIYFDKNYLIVYDMKNNIEKKVFYKKLLISTGASPIKPSFDYDGKEIFTIRNPSNISKLQNYIYQTSPKRAIIIGGGFIGLEMAEALQQKHINVTIIEGSNNILGDIDEDIHNYVYNFIESKGINIILNKHIENIVRVEDKIFVKTSNTSYETDLVIISIGVKPNTSFLNKTNLELSKNGAIKINNKMETNIKNVYAAGDCAEVNHFQLNKNVYFPLGTTANKQGKIAGKNISGKSEEFIGVLGSLITKYKTLEFTKTGLSLKKAKELNYDVDSIFIKSKNKAGYYSDSNAIICKIIFEKKSGKILGAQYAGNNTLARINPIISLIYSKGCIKDILNIDFPYAPPFSPVWDINLIAASSAMKKINML